MKMIQAFETSDRKRFFDEDEARKNERRHRFETLFTMSIRATPMFAKLEKELLVEFLTAHGKAIGELSNDPLEIERARPQVRPAGQETKRVGGVLTGQRAADLVSSKLQETVVNNHRSARPFPENALDGDKALMDKMTEALDAELGK